MSHNPQLLKDLERAITKTHEGLLDMLHAMGQIHALETEYVHTMDGLAEVEAAVHVTQETEQPESAPEPSAPVTPAPEPEPTPEPEPEPVAPVYKLEDARAELAKLTRSGRADAARQILANLGAHKLSEVPADRYGDIIQAVKDIA